MSTEIVPARALYDVPEAMAMLSLSRTQIYELIRSRRLVTVTQGRRRLVPAASIADYVALLLREAEAGSWSRGVVGARAALSWMSRGSGGSAGDRSAISPNGKRRHRHRQCHDQDRGESEAAGTAAGPGGRSARSAARLHGAGGGRVVAAIWA